MDIPKYALKGLGLVAWRGLGGREVCRGLRMLGWMYTDWRDPDEDNVAQRNLNRNRIRSKWGEWWTGELGGLPPVPPPPDLTVVERMEQRWQNNDLLLMGELSPAELRAYNNFFFQKSCLTPALEAMKMIEDLGPGPNNPYSHLFMELTDPENGTINHATVFVQDVFKDAAYRQLRYAQFREKLHYMKKSAKKVENANIKTFMVNLWNKTLHGLNDDTMKYILEKLMKILMLYGGEKDK